MKGSGIYGTVTDTFRKEHEFDIWAKHLQNGVKHWSVLSFHGGRGMVHIKYQIVFGLEIVALFEY